MGFSCDDDRLKVKSLPYQRVYDERGCASSPEAWQEFVEDLVDEWRYLYIDDLKEQGYEDDGDFDCYPQNNLVYCCDNSMGGARGDQWHSQHRADIRMIAVYGVSEPVNQKRDSSRIRYHQDRRVREFGDFKNELAWDKGHYLAHSIGGQIDNGIFAQRRDINRGWSTLGRIYRAMERYALENPGTFTFCRPIYGDGSDHPFFVELGVLKTDGQWWVEVFPNRYRYTPWKGLENAPQWYQDYVREEREKYQRYLQSRKPKKDK